jgi:hypothetical protein
MKRCTKCLENKPLEAFYMDSGSRDGLQSQCNECKSSYYQSNREELLIRRKEYDESHKVERIAYLNMHRYGLTSTQHKELMTKGCAVCGTKENLHIDHDHACCPGVKTCGKCVRGVLCRRHNTALGNVRDSVEELKALILYLT